MIELTKDRSESLAIQGVKVLAVIVGTSYILGDELLLKIEDAVGITRKTQEIKAYTFRTDYLGLCSYASFGAQCGVTTCCCCYVRDYHICFRLFALSSSSIPTLSLKDPRRLLTQFIRIFFWRSGIISD